MYIFSALFTSDMKGCYIYSFYLIKQKKKKAKKYPTYQDLQPHFTNLNDHKLHSP